MNKSAGGAKKYYSEEYYSEGKNSPGDYYSEKEQIIGKWGGIAWIKFNYTVKNCENSTSFIRVK